MLCGRKQSNGNVGWNTTVPPGTATDCPLLLLTREEYTNIFSVTSGTVGSKISKLETDVAYLQANGGGGSSTNFVPAYEAQSVICVQQNATTHALEVMNPQPTDKSTCTLIVGSFTESGGSLFSLTESQGAEIGVAMFAALAIAFAFRMVVRAIQETDSEKES